MSVTLNTAWNLSGFRSGLEAMKSESRTFRDTFRRNIESGGGLFGSLDKAFGKLAAGRFAAPIAAVGAALTVARVATEAMSKHWENMAASTARALQNVQAIESTRSAIAEAAKQGDALTAAQRIQQRGREAAATSAAAEASAVGDPSTNAGRRRLAKEIGGNGLGGMWHYLMLTGGAMGVPGMGGAYDAANDLYNQRQARAQETRQEADRARQLQPFVEFGNRSAQRAGDSAVESARERIDVSQGRRTGFEAAARAFVRANAEYEDTKKTFGDADPRTQQAKAGALSAFATYDSELTNARRFRNDPMIAADSLARLGGGGGVNVFGNGQGELLFEQKRMNASMQSVVEILRRLEVRYSRGAGGGIE